MKLYMTSTICAFLGYGGGLLWTEYENKETVRVLDAYEVNYMNFMSAALKSSQNATRTANLRYERCSFEKAKLRRMCLCPNLEVAP